MAAPDGDALVVLVGGAARKTWWRNLDGTAHDVTVREGGRSLPCRARLLHAGELGREEAIAAYLAAFPHPDDGAARSRGPCRRPRSPPSWASMPRPISTAPRRGPLRCRRARGQQSLDVPELTALLAGAFRPVLPVLCDRRVWGRHRGTDRATRTGQRGEGSGVERQDWTRVVEAATRAPSIHNTQPWSFTADGERLTVRTDPERGLHSLDPRGRQRLISCGVAVEFAAITLAAAGHAVDVELLPVAADPDLLAVVTVTGPHEPEERDRALGEAIASRHTERAPFLSRAVPAEVVDRLQATAGASRVWFTPITGEDEEVTTAFLVGRAEEIEQREPEYLAELQRWIRTDPAAVDGIPVGAVPQADPSTRPSNWLIRDFVVGSRASESAGGRGLDPDAPPPAVERPTVVLMGTDGDDRYDWVTAGRALGRVLLEATVAGLAASPLTQALDWPATRTQLRSRLSLVGHPQMLLRLGYPSADRSPSTNRRPVADVLTFV